MINQIFLLMQTKFSHFISSNCFLFSGLVAETRCAIQGGNVEGPAVGTSAAEQTTTKVHH